MNPTAHAGHDWFWRLLAESAACDPGCRQAHARIATGFSGIRVRLLHLERLLSRHQEPDVRRFHHSLVAVHRAAYRTDIHAAFRLLLGTIDTIEFGAALGWLVLQDRDFYHAVLVEPDLLAEADPRPADLRDASGIEEVAASALHPRPPESDDAIENYLTALDDSELELLIYPDPPAGDPIGDDPATLRRRFPRLTALYYPGR